MDWLFDPLGDFFVWSFGIITGLGMNFNYLAMAIGGMLMVYWIGQMFKHRHNDKGLYRKR